MALLLCAAGMGSALAQAPAPAVLAPAPGVPQSALPSLTASAATGQNLSELVAKARGYDAQWQAQQADAQAAASRAEQARSGLLPSVGLQAGANTSHVEVSVLPGSFRSPQQNLQLSAQQPLYRPANKIAYDQGQRGVDVARAQLDSGEQNLLVRVAQAYFDVLGSQDSLAVVRTQKAAIAQQLEFAKRNFEVGTATITDSREAQARFDLAGAQEIAAENDLRVKRLALDQIVGAVGTVPRPLAQPLQLPALMPADAQAWVDTALQGQPQLRQARLALDIAQLETKKAEAGHKPTVDLQAGYVVNRYPNGSVTPQIGTSYRTNAASVGVVMNLPLFAGFAVQNRIKETLALEDKARAGPGQGAGGRAGVQPERAGRQQAGLRGRRAHQHRCAERPEPALPDPARSGAGPLPGAAGPAQAAPGGRHAQRRRPARHRCAVAPRASPLNP
jgi:outer membrane protein